MTQADIENLARVITSNVILNLMNDLPGLRELIDRASRKKGYSWASEVDRFQADVMDILEGRLSYLMRD